MESPQLPKPQAAADDALAAERDLVARSVRGEPEAFRQLVARYHGPVYGAAYRALGDPTQAEDVTQEVFLKVYRNLSGFKHEKPLAHWIQRIASNATTDLLRSRRPLVSLESLERPPAAAQGDPQQALDTAEVRRALRNAIGRLPEHYRQALTLQLFHECSYQEIAGVLEVPLGTVMSRLHAAKRILRQELRGLLRSPE
jgi:RNA polymerase sigma-70 factor (ECF subfamily)